MSSLLFELPLHAAERVPDAPALIQKNATLDYSALAGQIEAFAAAMIKLGIGRSERIAIYLPKQLETVAAMFGAARAGCAFVPVNSLLKAAQVTHILRDCNVRVLVTSGERAASLQAELRDCGDLHHLILIDAGAASTPGGASLAQHAWQDLMNGGGRVGAHRVIDTDMVSIFYTSGSTGKPKGVVLSHRNMVAGAKSVASYLGNDAHDKLLAVLPFSFDYGFSQLSTAFHVGASVTLMDYLFARDILTLLDKGGITGLAGVPPLWAQLSGLEWPASITKHLRYITNSGGAITGATLRKLRDRMPETQVFLMYGLTEAFRSTYLPPSEIDNRPGSMGKAIPNAEIVVAHPDGSPCAPGEAGELVHRGSLVSLGYWNDAEKTAERFRPAPGQLAGMTIPEMAVWSGDTVKMDEDGFLYFIGRKDEMIKTSGYRVSPSEIEEVAFASGLLADAAAVGVPHPTLGQAVVLVAAPLDGHPPDDAPLLDAIRKDLPAFMVPARIDWRESLPRNPNGKYDRARLALELKDIFAAGMQ